MQLGIIIITYNIDARIFILQIENIRRFCKDPDYTIEVIDNSSKLNIAAGIKHQCKELGVKYRKTVSSHTDSSNSHAFAANLSFNRLQDTYDLFFYLDHDCIPVKDFSVEQILGDNVMAGVQAGIKTPYYWPGCLMWNNKLIDRELINFSPNHSLILDTGGETYRIVEKYRDKCLFFDEVGYQNPAFQNTPLYYFYMMIYEETFIHYINASNWNPTPDNETRLNSLINITIEKSGIHNS